MHRADIQLRTRADRGDGQAAVELGLRYLNGGAGLAPNHRLALQYLAGSALLKRELAHELASKVSLEDLVQGESMGLLAAAAHDGLAVAKVKLGAFKALQGDPRGWELLADAAGGRLQADAVLADFLRSDGLALTGGQAVVERLLRCSPPGAGIERALAVALCAFPSSNWLAQLTLRTLVQASISGSSLEPLSQSQITSALRGLVKNKDAVACFIVGSALVGLEIGQLQPQAVVARPNHREGFALLLRAAHYGEPRAWYQLFVACCDYRSSIANSEAAQFFLEQAANANIPQAARALGARTLQSANDLEGLLLGQRLLAKAASGGDQEAQDLLSSFHPHAALRELDEHSKAAIQRASGLHVELGLRLALARTFGLSREEAFKLDLRECIRGSSIILSRNYALPAATADAAESLRCAKAWSMSETADQTLNTAHDGAAIDSMLRAAGVEIGAFFRDCPRPGPRSLASWKANMSAALRRAANEQRMQRARPVDNGSQTET